MQEDAVFPRRNEGMGDCRNAAGLAVEFCPRAKGDEGDRVNEEPPAGLAIRTGGKKSMTTTLYISTTTNSNESILAAAHLAKDRAHAELYLLAAIARLGSWGVVAGTDLHTAELSPCLVGGLCLLRPARLADPDLRKIAWIDEVIPAEFLGLQTTGRNQRQYAPRGNLQPCGSLLRGEHGGKLYEMANRTSIIP